MKATWIILHRPHHHGVVTMIGLAKRRLGEKPRAGASNLTAEQEAWLRRQLEGLGK